MPQAQQIKTVIFVRDDLSQRHLARYSLFQYFAVLYLCAKICSGNSHLLQVKSLLGRAKVNKVKIFSRPYCMIKRVLTFVSGVQESVLLDFLSQNKVKILH